MRIREGHEKFIPVWIKRTRCRLKKKVFSSKIFTNSGHRLKILSIFHEFLSVEQKKKRGLRSKSLMKFGVSLQKLRKYGGKHQFGSLRPRFALQ